MTGSQPWQRPGVSTWCRDGGAPPGGPVSHLGIGAHPDDLEIMAFHGILQARRGAGNTFGGVVCTDGRGSPGTGDGPSGDELAALRREEQVQAAILGGYAFVLQLGHPSGIARAAADALVEDLAAVIREVRPRVIYTHNPADRHPTHVGVCRATVEALRRVAREVRPEKVYGCEVWRDLDWLPEGRKVRLDVSGEDAFARDLIKVFSSQIAPGKPYDRAAVGRRHAHATFAESHAVDREDAVILAMDLTSLLDDPSLSVREFTETLLTEFRAEVLGNL